MTKIVEHFWKFASTWELRAYMGASPAGTFVVLVDGAGSHEIKTRGVHGSTDPPKPPRAKASSVNYSTNLTWLLARLLPAGGQGGGGKGGDDGPERTLTFSIDRDQKTCRTPRRNDDVEQALTYVRSVARFAAQCVNYFRNRLFPIYNDANHGLDLGAIKAGAAVFSAVPAMFALEDRGSDRRGGGGGGEEAARATPCLALDDFQKFLGEQRRSLAAQFQALAKLFPASAAGGLVHAEEACVMVALMHVGEVSAQVARRDFPRHTILLAFFFSD